MNGPPISAQRCTKCGEIESICDKHDCPGDGVSRASAKPLDPEDFNPLDTLMPGEKFLPLMGRDVGMPGFSRLYAAWREGKYDRMPGIMEALIRAGQARAKHPHKDSQHAWSARKLADEMEIWYRQHMAAEGAPQRLDTAPFHDDDAFAQVPTHAEIKAARPPREPEEAN